MKYIKYPLSEIVDIISGGTPKKSVQEYWEHGTIPWLSIKDFNNDNRHVYNSSDYITELGLENSSTHLLEIGDVILSARGTVGEVAQLARRMAFNQSCFGLRADNKYTTNEYIYYWLKHNISYLKNNTHGSVFDTINRKTFENLYVELPTKQYQYEVTEILTKLDDKIELNKQITDTLEGMASTLFKCWFVDFEFPDENGNPYKASGGKMVEGELEEVPEGWEIVNLEAYVEIKYGKDHKNLAEGEYPVYGSGGIMRYVDKFLYSGESVLVPRKGTLSNVMYVDESFWSVDTMFYTIMKKNNIAKFIYLFLNGIDLKSMNVGSAVPSMTTNILNNMKIIKPPSQILEQFNSLISPMFRVIKHNKEENDTLKELRDTLLPKLLSGEIELPTEAEV